MACRSADRMMNRRVPLAHHDQHAALLLQAVEPGIAPALERDLIHRGARAANGRLVGGKINAGMGKAVSRFEVPRRGGKWGGRFRVAVSRSRPSPNA